MQPEGILLDPMMISMMSFKELFFPQSNYSEELTHLEKYGLKVDILWSSPQLWAASHSQYRNCRQPQIWTKCFCYAILQIINCQLHYASVSVGFAWCNWRSTAAPALLCFWVSGSPVKQLWPPLHRQTFLENSSLLISSAKNITNSKALYLGSKLK